MLTVASRKRKERSKEKRKYNILYIINNIYVIKNHCSVYSDSHCDNHCSNHCDNHGLFALYKEETPNTC